MSTTDITYSPVPPPPTTTATGTYAPLPSSGSTPSSTSSSGMDKNTFLKLMIAQVSHQDPTQPTDSSQWVSQMAQFTTVEQLTNMATSAASQQKDSQMTSAVGLIGRTVSYDGGSAGTVTGQVQAVRIDSNGPTLTIDGTGGIAPSAITLVS